VSPDSLAQLSQLSQIIVHQPFEPNRSPIFQYGYAALETVHDWTGLPWWATIPLTTLMVRPRQQPPHACEQRPPS
jgi:hypothetical protein